MYFENLSTQLGDHLGTKVTIVPGKKQGSGKISLSFYSNEQFEGILERLDFKFDDLEYIEVHNPTKADVPLAGLTLVYKGSVKHTIGSKAPAVKAGGYAVLARSGKTTDNGMLPAMVTYVYTQIGMSNSSGDIAVLSGKTEIDKVSYSKSKPWPGIVLGQTIQLSSSKLTADNNAGANWCQSTAPFTSKSFPAVLKGSPGKANAACK